MGRPPPLPRGRRRRLAFVDLSAASFAAEGTCDPAATWFFRQPFSEPIMGAGALSSPVLKQLQALREEEAVGIFVEHGIGARDAAVVTRRVRGLDPSHFVDGDTIAMLVEGLAPETQDALVAITSIRRPGNGMMMNHAGSARTLDTNTRGARGSPPRPREAERASPPPPVKGTKVAKPETVAREAKPERRPAPASSSGESRRSLGRAASEKKPFRHSVVPYPEKVGALPTYESNDLCNYETNDLMFPAELLEVTAAPKKTAQSARSYEAAAASEALHRYSRSKSEPEPRTSGRSASPKGGAPPRPGPTMTPHNLPNPIEPGKWKLGKLIGSGSYGTVFQGLRLDTGALIAIKTLILPPSASEDDDLSEIKQIHSEIELMSSLVHENIVTYLGAEQGRKRVIRRHFNVGVPEAISKRKASTL